MKTTFKKFEKIAAMASSVASFVFVLTFICSAVAAPIFVNAAPVFAIPIPCEGVVKNATGEFVQDCDFADLIRLISNIISFLLIFSITIATFIIAWCGVRILSAGSSTSQIEDAKKMLKKVLWGFFFALTAWLIVKLITTTLLRDGSYWNVFGANPVHLIV